MDITIQRSRSVDALYAEVNRSDSKNLFFFVERFPRPPLAILVPWTQLGTNKRPNFNRMSGVGTYVRIAE